MLSFGTIFRYKESFFVYLVEVDGLRYAARILDEEMTGQLIRSRDAKSKRPLTGGDKKPMYCFVVLTTEKFRDCAAHYGTPDFPNDVSVEEFAILNGADLEELKKEIMEDPATPILLRETVKKMYS